MKVYQIQFINPKWGGEEYEVEGNFRTFRSYDDACNALDKIGTAISSELKEYNGSAVECNETRDMAKLGDGLLTGIRFITTAYPTLNYIEGNVVPIEVVDELPKPVEEEPTEKTYHVELWYNLYREFFITAKSEEEALDEAREMPIGATALDNIQEVDCCVEAAKE